MDTWSGAEMEAAALSTLSVSTAAEANPLILAIDEAVEAQRALEQRLRESLGTNNTDFRALLLVYRLDRAGKGPRVRDFTRILGLTSGAASQAATRLREAGLLEQHPDPDNHRAGTLALTEVAEQRLLSATHAVRHDLDDVISTVQPDEQSRIIELLHRVRDVFSSHT